MKILKFTLLILAALIVLFFALAITLPSESRVTREIIVDKQPAAVYDAFKALPERTADAYILSEKEETDSMLHFTSVNNDIHQQVKTVVRFQQRDSSTLVEWTNITPLPLTRRLMNTKIEETTAPEIEAQLFNMKEYIEGRQLP